MSYGPDSESGVPYTLDFRNDFFTSQPHMPAHHGTTATRSRASARDVAIAIEASATFSRGVLQGVSRWIHENDGWMITIDDREPGLPIPGWFRRWEGDGLISGIESSSLPRSWRAGQRPVVHVRSRVPGSPLPGVYPDDEGAVRLAMTHLAERGVRQLVFSPGTAAVMNGMCDSLLRYATTLGCCLDIHEPRPPASRGQRHGDEADEEVAAAWLKRLPKPVGVIATSDVRALRIIEACRRGRLAVPDDVAVVGIGGDEVLCGLVPPGLTSVKHDGPRIGQEAARMLDDSMCVGRPPSAVILVPPVGIAVRRSSDVFAVEDADIRNALRVIRERACADLSAADVATEVRVPRRLLERKFQRAIGRTIHDELQRMKVAEAKRLLKETDDKLLIISMRSGFVHAPQLCNIFKSVVGMSPMEYRRTARSCRKAPVTSLDRGPVDDPNAA